MLRLAAGAEHARCAVRLGGAVFFGVMRWKVCGCVTSCCAAQELRGVRGLQEDVWVA